MYMYAHTPCTECPITGGKSIKLSELRSNMKNHQMALYLMGRQRVPLILGTILHFARTPNKTLNCI